MYIYIYIYMRREGGGWLSGSVTAYINRNYPIIHCNIIIPALANYKTMPCWVTVLGGVPPLLKVSANNLLQLLVSIAVV